MACLQATNIWELGQPGHQVMGAVVDKLSDMGLND
jgi:hypothetical protein